MKTAKIFLNGQSQAVRLPKEFRFQEDHVYVKKSGNVVLPYPGPGLVGLLAASLSKFTDDFLADREQPPVQKRKVPPVRFLLDTNVCIEMIRGRPRPDPVPSPPVPPRGRRHLSITLAELARRREEPEPGGERRRPRGVSPPPRGVRFRRGGRPGVRGRPRFPEKPGPPIGAMDTPIAAHAVSLRGDDRDEQHPGIPTGQAAGMSSTGRADRPAGDFRPDRVHCR